MIEADGYGVKCMNWYPFKSKDGKVRGYCPAETQQEVARFSRYPLSELVIERVVWNGKEFVKVLR